MSDELTPWRQEAEAELKARNQRATEEFVAEIEEILAGGPNADRQGRSRRDAIAAEIGEIIQRRAAELAAEVCSKLREGGGYD